MAAMTDTQRLNWIAGHRVIIQTWGDEWQITVMSVKFQGANISPDWRGVTFRETLDAAITGLAKFDTLAAQDQTTPKEK